VIRSLVEDMRESASPRTPRLWAMRCLRSTSLKTTSAGTSLRRELEAEGSAEYKKPVALLEERVNNPRMTIIAKVSLDAMDLTIFICDIDCDR